MKKMTRILILVSAVIAVLVVAGCVRLPTEKQSVADMRPSISFRVLTGTAADAQVFVDGIAVGTADQFLDGKAVLRVLPGSHVVRVVQAEKVRLNEKVYLGDGVNRTFIVN